MQHLIYLRTGIPRLYRVVNSNNHQSIFFNRNILLLKRCLSNVSNNNKNENDLGINTEIYKPSTTKKETHVPDDLKGGQPRETFDTPPKSTATLTGDGKVWSVQNPGSIHIAPLGAATTTFIPSSVGDGKTGQLNITDPLKTQTLQAEPTPGQLAEAAAASAFEPFAPDTPLTTSTPTDTVFGPKISSTDIYSKTTSPTGRFEHNISSVIPDATIYESRNQSKISGGYNTSTSTSSSTKNNYPTDHPSKTDQTSSMNEIPIQRESDIRDEILREALKYVDEKGWTMEAIRAGVRANNQPTTVEGLFSNGYDLVEYFHRDANSKMAAYMNEKSQKGDIQGTRLLIDGLKYRLGLVIPYANTWDQALAQGALPQNAMRSWKNLLDLSSDAWHGIGDTSTDINWYSKRLLLAAVYKSAEIYMLQDQSLDKIDTMNFLERRLNDFQAFGSVRNTVSKSLSDTAQIVGGLFSVVRNLTSRR